MRKKDHFSRKLVLEVFVDEKWHSVEDVAEETGFGVGKARSLCKTLVREGALVSERRKKTIRSLGSKTGVLGKIRRPIGGMSNMYKIKDIKALI